MPSVSVKAVVAAVRVSIRAKFAALVERNKAKPVILLFLLLQVSLIFWAAVPGISRKSSTAKARFVGLE